MNLQQREPPQLHKDGSELDVIEIWHTIQGEGPFAGRSAVFVRLAGCNLQCPECDTDYTSKRKTMEMSEILKDVWRFSPKANLVVLTGGEPLRQNLRPLCDELLAGGYAVQIETNGLFYQDLPWGQITTVCSPKTRLLHAGILPHIDAYKYVVEEGHVDADGLPSTALGGGFPARPPKGFDRNEVYLQPMDSGDSFSNSRNTAICVDLCLCFGWRFSLQIHKIIGVD